MDQRETKSNRPDSFDSDAAWDFLSDLIDQFCTEWDAAPPIPEFEPFAEQIKQIDNAEFRKIALIELVKVEFEFRSQESFAWRELAWYVNRWPDLGSEKSPPAELVNEEKRLGSGAAGSGEGQPSLMRDFEPDATYTAAVFRSREAHQFKPGDSIDDFDLLARLGRGAFATVFLARQVSMQRLVALKISADQGLEGPTLAKLNHPHIVRVFDQRVVPERSLRLMYMEYVAGGSLNDVIKQSKTDCEPLSSMKFLESLDEQLAAAGNSPPIESTNRDWLRGADWPKAVARIGAQLAGAIGYTHREGVLHRDIKPANILIDEHGFPKLVDFNISFGDGVIGATAASCFGGSLGYMSPEQLEAFHPMNERAAEEIDGGCDVFALGVTLHELLTGERPFSQADGGGGDPMAMIDQMLVERKSGLTEQQLQTLHTKDHLLGGAIESSLHPDVASRPDVTSLQRRLLWAADGQFSDYLKPTRLSWSNWRSMACRFPWPFIMLTVLGVSLFATNFIIVYNVTESVSQKDQGLFLDVRQMINRVVFPLAFVLLIGLFFRTQRLLRDGSRMHSKEQFKKAIESNLNFGHAAALMCIGIWTIAGLLYPIVLSAKGAKLPAKAWADFSISHLLAGLICGAFVFFGLTMFSVVAWHPRLVMAAMKSGTFVEVDEPVGKIRSRVYIYRVLAIGAPLVAIATLVNFRTNTFAVSCLSIGAILGLLAMAYAIRKIGHALDLLDRC